MLISEKIFYLIGKNKLTQKEFSEQTLKGRKRIPLTDPEVNVTYHLISSAKSTILQSVSPTFEFRYQK